MTQGARRLLVLDTSYALEAIQANRLEASVTCRDLGGYFDRVWTVHPFASLVSSDAWGRRNGPPVETSLNGRHAFIEGKVGRFDILAAVPALNFLVGQGDILFRLRRLVRTHHISAVRAGDPLLMGFYGWVIARACGIPLVIRMSGNYENIRRRTGRPMMPRFFRSIRLERAVERFVVSRADLVAAGNEDNLRYVLSMGVHPERATVFRIGNLVDPVHFSEPSSRVDGGELLAPLGLRNRVFLLCIGRLEPIKMPDDAIRALALLRAGGIDAALLLVGSGSMLSALQDRARELGVEEQVTFAGQRDQEWLARVIPHAAAVLSPLTGRALSEVALGGAPTVAYDLDWHAELIRSGVNGTLVPAGDVAGMARAAACFLSDPAAARRMGSLLRESALAMMDPERLDAHERTQYTRLFQRWQHRR